MQICFECTKSLSIKYDMFLFSSDNFRFVTAIYWIFYLYKINIKKKDASKVIFKPQNPFHCESLVEDSEAILLTW